MKNFYKAAIFATTVFFMGCEPEIDKEKAGGGAFEGNANFTTYLALGDSYTAGFADGALYRSGQEQSFALILAQQFLRAGGGSFNQPLMFDELGLGGRVQLTIHNDCRGNAELSPTPVPGTPSQQNHNSIGIQGPFHNMGIPGARVIDLADKNYSGLNEYFGRMASSRTATILDDAARIRHTFFTLETGVNDVMLYALNGSMPALQSLGITPASTFEASLENVVKRVVANGAKGVILDLPTIEELPYFNVIPYDDLVLTKAEADQLNMYYLLNPAVRFKEGRNPFVILDGLLPRLMRSDEKVVLTLNRDSVKCKRYGSYNPLPDKEVLTTDEIAEIHQAVLEYNSSIHAMSEKYKIPLFSMNSFFKQLQGGGIHIDGVAYTDEYAAGGFYSLDGVHPTPRGNAILANKILRVINAKFQSGVPLVNINTYNTVKLP